MRTTRQHANKMQIPKANWGFLEEALEQEVSALAKGRSSLAKGGGVPLDSAKEIDLAVDSLRKAGRQDFICHGLLVRFALRWEMGNSVDEAQRDLKEAWEIAERGPMRLNMADIHLYRARFHDVKPYPWDTDEQGDPRGPRDDLAAARRLIEQCGYWRRKEELEDAEEAARSW